LHPVVAGRTDAKTVAHGIANALGHLIDQYLVISWWQRLGLMSQCIRGGVNASSGGGWPRADAHEPPNDMDHARLQGPAQLDNCAWVALASKIRELL